MHSVEELGTNVPAFLAKLWKMVEDSETNDLICWSPNGTSFCIHDQARFAREMLPMYYKHNNMASFVRQLNMYGFHKVVSIESGGLKIDRDDMEFAHQCFLLGHPYLLEHIKRKIPTNKSEDGRAGSKPELVNKVLSEVKTLKGRQDSVDSQLTNMKRENEVLWREVAILRQKHIKQQQIVNKLIQFLVSMVQTSRGGGIGIKRHYPLMLNDITHHSKKTSSKSHGNISEVNSVTSGSSPTGPVIHELDAAELLDDCTPAMDDETSPAFDLCDSVNSHASEDMTTADIASATMSSTPSATSVSAESTDAAVASDGSILDTSEVLLELAEEVPLDSEMLLTTGSSQPFMVSARPTKGKQKSTVLKGSKRRKSKLMPSLSKSTSPSVNIKRERNVPVESVNVNNFLEIMLPSLVNGADSSEMPQETIGADSAEGEFIIPDLSEESLEINSKEPQSSLDAATSAAISAISNVAAAQEATTAAAKTNVGVTPTNVLSKTNYIGEKSMSNAKEQEESGSSNKDLTLACASSGDPYKCKEDLDSHLENMQTELDTLKELLKGEGYNLDANMLLGLFGDESFSFGIPFLPDQNSGKDGKQNGVSDPMVSGSELMTYSSNLLDLADMSELDDWSSPTDSSILTGNTNDDLNTPIVTINNPGFSGLGATAKKKKTK